jgi:NAD(P)H-nitrite reductase large subunit
MAKYTIIGASAAGVGAVEAIREIDPQGSITIITEEQCTYYSRPMISEFVSGKADATKSVMPNDDFWTANNVDAKNLQKAVSLDLTAKIVSLDDGR